MDIIKPSKIKVILTIIFFILLFFGSLLGEFDSNTCDTYTEDLSYAIPLYLPLTIINGIHNSLNCGSFMCADFWRCTERLPSSLILIGWLLELIYIYLIISLILYFVKKERPIT